jgi:hypothetical protein
MLKGLIRSFFALGRQILRGNKPDVVFYYPRHFNRTVDGTNPYFKPLIELCKNNSINYIALEEPAAGYPSDSHSIKADVFVYFTLVMHRILMNSRGLTQHEADKRIGKLIDVLTFHRLRAKTYITISNSMIDVLGELNPCGNVYDMQHGIIYCGHPGYFLSENELKPVFKIENRRVLLWGSLYKNNLRELPGDIDLDKKFIVAGYPLYKQIDATSTIKDKVIMVSLQFTGDISPEKSYHLMEMLEQFADTAIKEDYSLILKHHPRFADEVDLNTLLQKYNGRIILTKDSLDELARKSMLHVTWGSTTTFEYAAYGVPTFFLYDGVFDWASNLFYEQYLYPLYKGMSAEQVLNRISESEDYIADCKAVKVWYEAAYSPLNEDLLLKILKGESNFNK